MSFIAAPYVLAGTVSLFLGYKTYNSYYNQPFEYIEIEGSNEDPTEKPQESDILPVTMEQKPEPEPQVTQEPEPQVTQEPEPEPQVTQEPELEKKVIEKVSSDVVKRVLNKENFTNEKYECKKISILPTIQEEDVKKPIEIKRKYNNNNLRKRKKKKI